MAQKKYYLISFIIMFALTAGVAVAGNYFEKRQDRKEIRQDKKELGATSATYTKLSSNIDRWVEANLKGNDKKAQNYEEVILELIGADITSTRRMIEQHKAEVLRSTREYNSLHNTRVARCDDRADLREDVSDLNQAKQLLSVKERLASTLKQSTAFSNKYRLLGDYLEVLRRELGITRVELAEDVKELHEDRAERRRK